MDDRALLELAAKAAGMKFMVSDAWHDKGSYIADGEYWNPLEDDGDALRLAVKLHINIEHLRTLRAMVFNEVSAFPFGRGDCMATMPTGDDPAAATRRAIITAAASLAK